MVKAVAGQNGYAYVAAGRQGLAVVDVADPAYPVVTSLFDLPSYALDVSLAGPYAYVTTELAGLHIVDIADPTTPRLLGVFDEAPLMRPAIVRNGYAYVMGDGRLRVVDLSNPTRPVQVAQYAPPNWVADLKIIDDIGYVMAQTGGLHIVDLTNPAQPVELGVYETSHEIQITDIYLLQENDLRYAYLEFFECLVGSIACMPATRLLDLSNFNQPTELMKFREPSGILHEAKNSSYVYLFKHKFIYRFDVANPITPTLVTNDEYQRNRKMTFGDVYKIKENAGLEILASQPTSIPPSAKTSVTLAVFTTPLTVTHPAGPQELMDRVPALTAGELDTIWRTFDIEPGNYLDLTYLRGELFKFRGDEQNAVIMLKIDLSSKLASYVIFTVSEDDLQFQGYISNVYSHYGDRDHQFITHGTHSEDSWFTITRTSGGGTGYALYQEDWYYLSEEGPKLVLSYPTFSYENHPSTSIHMSLEGQLIQTDAEKITVDIEIRCQFSKDWQSEDADELLLFELLKQSRYEWRRDAEAFVNDKGELHVEEVRQICPVWQKPFVEEYFDQLIALANSEDEQKREWLKHYVRTWDNEARHSEVGQALLEALELSQ